ncbi:hypothetical protein MVLG_04106 [Microbotryum lychnidis-dioicae p1A1 Lamole]|uniref:Uncharacterized protein n=1 Tax=Microbotryum lychnidis-dioicae (strain p1A1 Lamole / MvSl-1064) TaxID=683840 RepID=U5HA72_USTV1|nr:hypothetical protein MVLG_04106 [Microbotryum lychnidis-dioicae p1A1 Lamole]|eukprot:KDE05513.1 hypothetical protein MVLG_04106 [Microbotryum lychnidis-dioicae p1A1 Lamole]
MKYSLVFVALVVIATRIVSALAADATKQASTSEVDYPYFPEEHAATVSQGPPTRPITHPVASTLNESLVNCKAEKCTTCKGEARGTCIEQCASWMAHQASQPEPEGC